MTDWLDSVRSGYGLLLAQDLGMVRFAALFFVVLCLAGPSEAAKLKTLIRCQLVDGYELALQTKGKSYFLSLMLGGNVEHRQRLKKPHTIRLNRDKNNFNFELMEPGSDQYVVRIASNFDGGGSYGEFVHYRLRPRSSSPNTYKVYEAAGDGLPLKDLGCVR